MASIDRQALLEQKRRRLQELKERRTGVSLVDATQPNLAIAEPAESRTKVDFAVQVDLIQPITSHFPPSSNPAQKSVHIENKDSTHVKAPVKFDKVVQTHFERLADPEPITDKAETLEPVDLENDQIPPISEQDMVMDIENKVESSINDFLRDAGFHFSDLRLGVKHEQTGPDSDIVAPFNVTKSVSDFINRPIVALASTPAHPEVFLAAYSSPPSNSRSKKPASMASAGLAVIFNKSSGTIVPEFFLQCTSCIRTIMFDKSNSFKVFAGLENGRVVMWDLANAAPTQVAVLPTLQTSTVASAAVKSQHNFVHHISPIILMAQLNTESSQSSGILTICADGVVNLWSPNFLAFPKIASLRLSDDSIGPRMPFKLTDALISLAILRIPEQTGRQNSPEYNFLNSTIIASRNGIIYKLINVKEKAFIRSKLIEAPGIEEPRARGVNAIVELKYNASTSFLLSAHADWSLRLWDMDNCTLRFVSPTTTLVTSIVVRPGHGGQFITISNLRPPKFGLYVEFWDIKAKILRPISIIPTREKKSGTALFNADGSEMVLAYDDGEIDIFSIEESLLSSQVSSQSYASVDEGVDKLLSSL